MMTLIRKGALVALPLLASALNLKSSVTAIGVDSTAGANWRTSANLDDDQEYGTSGYVIFGMGESDSVYTTNYNISSANSNNVYNLPAGVGVTTIDTNIGMWSGNGNFGTLEDPTAGNAITSAPVLANSSGTRRFTINRSNSNTFRLTIFTASGDNEGTEYTVSVDDGSGSRSTNHDHTSNGVVYHVFDISSGTSEITIDVASVGQNRSLMGIAFDSAIDITDPTDSDNDGMGDNWETFHFGDLSRDGSGDFDSDGLIDEDEWTEGTSPNNSDSDDDDLTDGQEINTYNTDPLESDSDNDGFSDGDEISGGTNPNNNGSFPVVTVGRPTLGSPNSTRDSVVVFSEIHYHPAEDNDALEYIELYNQMAINVDLSNWYLDGIDFHFPEGTVINARSYLVIAKDPGSYPGALGPYAGTLSNSGETLRLYNNNLAFRTTAGAGPNGAISDSLDRRRVMDEISYGDTHPWPLGPDGSGSTLAKIDPATGSAHPQNWTHSTGLNGTPGAVNNQTLVPAISFNELGSSTSPIFQLELHNHGALPVSLEGMVITSSNTLHADYTLPPSNLAPGTFTTIDATTLGFTPFDNERLFLFTPGKVALINTARVDNRLKGRSPDGTGRWLNPNTATFGSTNSFTFEDDIVINEIFYHAYPLRSTSGTLPTYTDVQVMDFDHVWRYNLDAGTAGLPPGWEDTAHTVDDISWSQGPGLLGFETASLSEPILTEITRVSKIPYYFETEFTYNDPAAVDQIVFDHLIDDGAVIYLNGEEIARYNMDDGPFTPTTPGVSVSNATPGALTVNNPNILQGSNRLSIEIHQTTTTSSDLVLGIRATLKQIDNPGTPSTPYTKGDEEWLELYNRGGNTIDLSSWEINGGISYNFPVGTMLASGEYLVVAKDASALAQKHPGITIVGDFSGSLGNGGDHLVLEDAHGNPADEVTYFDGGKWPGKADGGGSSVELLDPDADNNTATAWAASDETERSSWNTFTYEEVAVSDGIGNNAYHEFLIALLDSGEFLLDDVSVIENGSTEMIQNGDFEGDSLGSTADKWRALGTHGSHGKTVVVDDPDSPGNQCLHIVATGPTGDKHNKLETTFSNNEQVTAGATYRISFRAKFLCGNNQVNSRLYFNYLQRTTTMPASEIWGTPGEINSTALGNIGPTMEALAHAPVVPDANQSVNVAIDASDADGIDNLTLFYSINGGAFQSSPMAAGPDGVRYVGTIPGQSASRIIRFYIRALDTANATSFYPAAGPESGAFYKVQDGLADNSGNRHNFRVVMSESDRQFLFNSTNRMSNDRFPVTVIEDETTAYYDVGLRLKASAYGRFQSGHYGFNVRFQPDQLFRGVHTSVSVERSRPFRELFAKHLLTRAGGGYWSFYDDVSYAITPNSGDRGPALLSMARHTNNFFDGLFPDEDESGTLFNHELLYSPNGTNGGPEGLKIGNPYNHNNGRYDLDDRGADKEPYRFGFQIRSARGRDDYSQIIAVNQAVGELSGTDLKNALDPIIDVDQWMRTFAMATLTASGDTYGRVWEHNFRYFVRPTDQKVIVLQWDLDSAFGLGSSESILPTRNNIRKLFNIPQYRRLFDGHLEDIVNTTYNTTYSTTWANHLGSVSGSNFSSYNSYINSRGNFALGTLPSNTTFAITTNGGNNFSEADSAIDLEGDGWVDVFSITVNNIAHDITWLDGNTWQLTIPISIGANLLTLKAYNNQGLEVGTDSITVSNTSSIDLASATNTIIRELHYHPADPTAAEINAGFLDSDEFEFIEILNTSTTDVDLSNTAFTDGIEFTFPAGTTLAPGARLVIVSNRAAFEFRYGTAGITIAGEYSGRLNNGGEHVRYEAADTSAIADFTYTDDIPWPTSADGNGYSLIFSGTDPNSPLDWRTSIAPGGNPGSDDGQPFNGTPDELAAYLIQGPLIPQIVGDTFQVSFLQNLNADDALVVAEYTIDLVTWIPLTSDALVSKTNQGDGTSLLTYETPLAPSGESQQFVRLRMIER
ncbi:lamin tail domain-containing protein [bacterium]|nr:lamin tail domain-containing protein [bacterium]